MTPARAGRCGKPTRAAAAPDTRVRRGTAGMRMAAHCTTRSAMRVTEPIIPVGGGWRASECDSQPPVVGSVGRPPACRTQAISNLEVRSREVTLKQKQDLSSNTHVTRPPPGEDSTRLRHRHTLGVLHIRKRIGAPLQHGRHGQPVLKRWRRCRRRGVCVELDRLARRHQLIARRAPCTAAPAQMHAVDCPTKQKCGADDVNVFGRGHEPRHRGRGRWRSD